MQAGASAPSKRSNHIEPMKSFLIMFCCYVSAGVYGVIVAQTAISSVPAMSHSGTQSYVRTILR